MLPFIGVFQLHWDEVRRHRNGDFTILRIYPVCMCATYWIRDSLLRWKCRFFWTHDSCSLHLVPHPHPYLEKSQPSLEIMFLLLMKFRALHTMKYNQNIDSTTLKGLCNLTTENHFNFNKKYFLTGFLSSNKSSFRQ